MVGLLARCAGGCRGTRGNYRTGAARSRGGLVPKLAGEAGLLARAPFSPLVPLLCLQADLRLSSASATPLQNCLGAVTVAGCRCRRPLLTVRPGCLNGAPVRSIITMFLVILPLADLTAASQNSVVVPFHHAPPGMFQETKPDSCVMSITTRLRIHQTFSPRLQTSFVGLEPRSICSSLRSTCPCRLYKPRHHGLGCYMLCDESLVCQLVERCAKLVTYGLPLWYAPSSARGQRDATGVGGNTGK